MATTTDKALRDLVLINNERREGYRKAAEDVEDATLQILFTELSRQSEQFATELKQQMEDYEERPDHDATSLPSKLHRAWIDIKSAVSGRDREAILSSCEFGDSVAVEEYDQVLDEEDANHTTTLHHILQRQRDEIERTRVRIKALHD